jgi:hypothetical protein
MLSTLDERSIPHRNPDSGLFLYLLACLLIGPILTALYDCGDGGCLGGGSTKECIIVT